MILLVVLIVSSLGFLPDRVRSAQTNVSEVSVSRAELSSTDLALVGSRRLYQSLSAYWNSDFLGGVGAGNGELTLVDDSVDSPFPLGVVADRFQHEEVKIGPSSYLSQLSYELGISTALLLLFCLVRLKQLTFHGKLWLGSALVQLLFFSSTLMPTPWVILGVIAGMQKGRVVPSPHISGYFYRLVHR